ncbi:LysR family transcriptional regulator [Casimicrobium huifangae]|uniref:LysR family transcriptional regulator n=1 Tax=Casimicrobium huifangae TaxID=2591109 RepID=UPI0012EBF2F6|nr:LysR family transcriptional regulator [Casimicrobium huifangae]
MPLSGISLNALRAFEAAARHLNFTRAADELCVTQAAVSHQVKTLEDQLGNVLFRRTARGLVLTDEGAVLMPAVADSFLRLERALDAVRQGGPQEVLTVGVVGTFATGFLLPRVGGFRAQHPRIDLRLLGNNNKVDLASDNLDYAIRFGDGAWRSVEAQHLMNAPLAPLCSPAAAKLLRHPDDLSRFALLRSYRPDDWATWLAAAGVKQVFARGAMFDSSSTMVQAAMAGLGIALAPPCMFTRELDQGRLVQPFPLMVDVGSYWLTRLTSRQQTPAMTAFRTWLAEALRPDQAG